MLLLDDRFRNNMTIVAPINRTERIWGAGLHRREAGFILGRATRWADGGCGRSLRWSSSKMARHRLPPPALTSPHKPHLQLPCYFGIDHLGLSSGLMPPSLTLRVTLFAVLLGHLPQRRSPATAPPPPPSKTRLLPARGITSSSSATT